MKTKKELLNEVWEEFDKKRNLIEEEVNKKIKEIEEKFKGKCEVCGK